MLLFAAIAIDSINFNNCDRIYLKSQPPLASILAAVILTLIALFATFIIGFID